MRQLPVKLWPARNGRPQYTATGPGWHVVVTRVDHPVRDWEIEVNTQQRRGSDPATHTELLCGHATLQDVREVLRKRFGRVVS